MKQRLHAPYGSATTYTRKSAEAHVYVLVVPGYGESIAHNKQLVESIARHGYNAFTFSYPRGLATPVVNPILRQRDVTLCVIEAVVPEGVKVHVAAHSFGAATALSSAQARPTRFASLTLMQPVGMTDNQSLRELAYRSVRKTAKNPPRAIMASAAALLKNPILALQEAIAAKNYDISDDAAAVNTLGIPIHIVKSQNDELFHADVVHTKYETLAESIQSGLSLADKQAGHDSFWREHEHTAQIIHSLMVHNRGNDARKQGK